MKAIYQVLLEQNAEKDLHGDESGKYLITTIYLCTWKSPNYRGKIRLRMYQKTSKEKSYFIENKYKNADGKFKKRLELTSNLFNKFVEAEDGEMLITLRSFLSRIFPLDNCIQFIPIKKRIILTYIREAYILKINNNEIRITIDSDLETILPDGRAVRVNSLDKEERLLEIKGADISSFFEMRQIAPLNLKEKAIKFSKYKKAKKTYATREVNAKRNN